MTSTPTPRAVQSTVVDRDRPTPDQPITVCGLCVDYDGFRAVDDLSFTVARGEVVALLGTNGAGKTTTLDVLGGFIAPSSGSVRVLGHDPRTDRGPIAPRVGTVLQEAGFFQDLTVEETVRAWRRFSASGEVGARSVEEALALVALSGRARTRVRRLSGGERRRLDLALAILGRPEVLFLDEPTTGLDPEARHRTWTLISDLVRSGTTVLLTTHYMEEAEALAERAVILDRGRAVTAGRIADLVEAAARSRITFRVADSGTALPALPATADMGGAVVRSAGGEVAIETADPQHTLYVLLAWAAEHGLQLAQLEARSATLEDVFLGASGGDDAHDALENTRAVAAESGVNEGSNA